MEWLAILVLLIILALGGANLALLLRFMSVANENRDRYAKIMEKLDSMKETPGTQVQDKSEKDQ